MELSSSSSRRQSLSSNLIPHPHLYNLIKDIFIHTPVIMNGHCIWAIDPSVALVTRETLDRVLDPRPGEPRPPTFGPEHGQLSGPHCPATLLNLASVPKMKCSGDFFLKVWERKHSVYRQQPDTLAAHPNLQP